MYEKDFEFTVPSNTNTYVTLDMPPRGKLRRFNLRQVEGVLAGFACDLYSSARATPTESDSSEYVDGEPDLPAEQEIFKVMPTRSAAALAAAIEDLNIEYTYENRDGGISRREGKLYLRMRPAGTGSKTFQLSVAVETPTF